ncbi:hypothetical protein CspeluHIS016_0505740 [Cutaneotrichosporon spelunceum]|uniref:Tyrosine specific protein phosphatases domain-containing protein n=1 Tax=Cutaneotrichosporon spelunceum TaxID=1672016 RepID=A0AAD3TY52_9TREE|nr:hypothetical protein CspeluHIS016_0505740 [Cutaneotrichosporon spelunceum]
MPLSRAQLEALTLTDIREPIAADLMAKAVAGPPFVQGAPRILNLRDLGGAPGSCVRPGLVYRSATLAGETPKDTAESTDWLSKNVRTVYDLRREKERQASPDPVAAGVDNFWREPSSAYGAPRPDLFTIGDGTVGWKYQYMVIAAGYRETFRNVLEHIRDRPGEPILIHCSAGRDRTGVLSGLLQALAGTAAEDVKLDYMLSRVGIETQRKRLLTVIMAGVGTLFKGPDDPGLYNLSSLRPQFWTAFLEDFEDKYGGWEGYAMSEEGLGFSAEDLAQIRRNLRGECERSRL